MALASLTTLSNGSAVWSRGARLHAPEMSGQGPAHRHRRTHTYTAWTKPGSGLRRRRSIAFVNGTCKFAQFLWLFSFSRWPAAGRSPPPSSFKWIYPAGAARSPERVFGNHSPRARARVSIMEFLPSVLTLDYPL